MSSTVLLTFGARAGDRGHDGLDLGQQRRTRCGPATSTSRSRRLASSCRRPGLRRASLAVVVLAGCTCSSPAPGSAARSAPAPQPERRRAGRRERRDRRRAHVRHRRRRPPAPAARSSACSIRSCRARTTSGSRDCWRSSCSAGMGSLPGAVAGRAGVRRRRDDGRRLHLAGVGDRGAVPGHLRRAARPPAGAAWASRLREDVAPA